MVNYSNRGKLLELLIFNGLNEINKKELGSFYKSPTVIKPINVNYNNGTPVITRAIFAKKALCDFYGIYKSKFVLIEAKEVKTTSFNLSNIKEHQIQQLIDIKRYGGLSLIIICFVKHQTYHAIDIDTFLKLSKDVKSIKYEEIKKWSFSLTSFNLKINLIDCLDYLLANQL